MGWLETAIALLLTAIALLLTAATSGEEVPLIPGISWFPPFYNRWSPEPNPLFFYSWFNFPEAPLATFRLDTLDSARWSLKFKFKTAFDAPADFTMIDWLLTLLGLFVFFVTPVYLSFFSLTFWFYCYAVWAIIWTLLICWGLFELWLYTIECYSLWLS